MQTSTMSHIRSNARLIGVLDATTQANLPQFLHRLSAGCPTTPSDEFDTVDLNSLCLQHPAATALYRAGGLSMLHAGIDDGDYLIVDTQIEPKSGQIIAACYFGETLVKELSVTDTGITLIAHNDNYPNVDIDTPDYFRIIGVVTWVFADKRNFKG